MSVSDQPTRVLLARHGDAVPEGMNLPDEYRYLSARGRDKVRGVAEVLVAEGVSVDAVLTSPLTRAAQTAELLAAGVGFQGAIEADVGLLPRSVPMMVARSIQERLASLSTLLVVGHMPAISGLGAALVGMAGFPSLKPGHVLVLDDGRPAFKVDPDRHEVEQFLLRDPMLIFESLDQSGRTLATHLSRQGDELLLSVGDQQARVPARVVEAVMRRYGRELDPDIPLDGEGLALGDGLTLQRFRFHARVDAEGRDYLALVTADGAPPLAVMATTVAGAFQHLLGAR